MSKDNIKHTRNERARIRYQLLRDAGYSVAEAQRYRYRNDFDISKIKVDSDTGKVIKNTRYKEVSRGVRINETMNRLRRVPNPTVFTQHGYLTNKNIKSNVEYRDEYTKLVKSIQRKNKLSNDQAYYFAHFMLQSGYSYEQTRKQLLGKADFEMYRNKNRGKK